MSSKWQAEKEFWFVKIWRHTRHTVERDCDEDDEDKLDNQTAEQRTLDSVVDIANLSSLSCWRKYQFWGEAIDIDDHGNSSLWTSSFANEIAIACHIGNLGALCACPLQRIRFGHQLERFDICSPEAVWHSEVDVIYRERWFWSRGFVLWYLIERIHLAPTQLSNQPICSSPGGRKHSAINVTLTEKLFSSTNYFGRIMRIPVGSASGTPHLKFADENVSSRLQQMTAGHKLSDIRRFTFRHELKAVCRPRGVSNRHSSNCPSLQLARFWSWSFIHK